MGYILWMEMMIEWRKIYFCLMILRLYLFVFKILIIRNKLEKNCL